jgi:hypothetical protein
MSQSGQNRAEPDRDEDVPRGDVPHGDVVARPGGPDDLTEPADRLPGESDAGAGASGQDRGTPEPPD